MRATLTRKPVIIFLLVIQIIPLMLFPPPSFEAHSQEWWLPLMLAVLILLAVFEILFQHQEVYWHLISFAQGFSIISRLMMLWAHSTLLVGGSRVPNTAYLVLTTISMLWSFFMLWYVELPDVKMEIARA